MVGIELGELLGEVVGPAVGDVGPILGEVLGDIVGPEVGNTLGPVIGEALGSLDGLELGESLGEVVGPTLTLGAELGEAEGKELGVAAGSALGVDVGSRLGDSDGKALGNEEGKALGIVVGIFEGVEIGSALGRLDGTALGIGGASMLVTVIVTVAFATSPPSSSTVYVNDMVVIASVNVPVLGSYDTVEPEFITVPRSVSKNSTSVIVRPEPTSLPKTLIIIGVSASVTIASLTASNSIKGAAEGAYVTLLTIIVTIAVATSPNSFSIL